MKMPSELPDPQYKNVQNYRRYRKGDGWWVVLIVAVILLAIRIFEFGG